MRIMSQDRKKDIPYECAIIRTTQNNYIIATMFGQTEYTLGIYENDDVCQRVFQQISKYYLRNPRGIFIMPIEKNWNLSTENLPNEDNYILSIPYGEGV